MQKNYLCPIYRKWLQLHPEHARLQRSHYQEQAIHNQFTGDLTLANQYQGKVYEVALAIVLSPRAPGKNQQQDSQDLLALCAATLHLSKYYRHCHKHDQAIELLSSTQQKLVNLLPLYASEPALLNVIQIIIENLQAGCDFIHQFTQVKAHVH